MDARATLTSFLVILVGSSAKDGSNEFSSELFKEINIESQATGDLSNIIVSPLSGYLVLSLIAYGGNGRTLEELQEKLYLPLSKEQWETEIKYALTYLNQSANHLKVALAYKIYISEKFDIKQKYKQTAITVYNSEIEKVNFNNPEAANCINNWVAQRTNHKIIDLVEANEIKDAAILLINTIYFSGEWQTPFSSRATTKQTFYTSSGKTEIVDMMQSPRFGTYGYKHCGYLQAKFLEIPFKDGNFSMTFVLPDSRDGLSKVANNIHEYIRVDDLKYENVAVSLPKFNITSESDFKPVLQKMGIKALFDKIKANLSDISDKKNLFVTDVIQKAVMSITETGALASAATAVVIGTTSVFKPPTDSFIADHPFLFWIKDPSDVILFIGQFVKSI